MPVAANPSYKAEVGSAIANARAAKGLPQQKLAQRIEVSSQSVSEWECGRSAPGLEPLRRLCEVLEVPPHVLLAMPSSSSPQGDLLESLIARIGKVNGEMMPSLLALLREAEAEARELRAQRRI